MQSDDKQKTLFGYPVVEVEIKDVSETPKIVFGDFSYYITWRIRKRHLVQRVVDGLRALASEFKNKLFTWLRNIRGE